MGRGAVAVVAWRVTTAGRADHPPAGGRDPDVVDPIVGEEFRDGVKLVAVPAGVLEHAELRKPLRDEEEVSDCPGPRERAWDPRPPLELDVDGLARGDRRRHRHGEHRPVIEIPVIR